MANIHQTMKRIEKLYADLRGTREELITCVLELYRWHDEVRPLVASVTQDIERMGRTIRQHQKEIDVLAGSARQRWAWVVMGVVAGGAVGTIFLAGVLAAVLWGN